MACCQVCGSFAYHGASDAPAADCYTSAGKAFELGRDLGTRKIEVFRVALLTTRLSLIKRVTVGLGTVSECPVYPREVFRAAIRHNAAAVVLFHNHPSGDTSPSDPDKELTARLVAAGRLLDIRVVDHLIITRTGYLSFREAGLWPA